MKKKLIQATLFFLIITGVQSCGKESNDINKKIADNISNFQDGSVDPGMLGGLGSGLICYLPLNGNLLDKSGNGNHGTKKNGSISYVKDKSGHDSSALSLVGTSAFIEIPDGQIAGLTTGTFSINFYPTTATGSSQYLISKMSYDQQISSPDFYQSLGVGFQTASNMGVALRSSDDCDAAVGTDWNIATVNTSFALNTWNNVIVTFDNNIEKVYLNGNIARIKQKSPSAICAGEPLRLGVWWAEDPSHFNGYLDEFRIYNRVLTTGEIKRLAAR